MENYDCKSIVKGNSPETQDIKLEAHAYSCYLCPSLIEILSINENKNIIKFKCSNKNNFHEKSIEIKDYLERNKQNDIFINDDTCTKHGEKYQSFCLLCNKHLCNGCQRDTSHLNHHKINLPEVEPIPEEIEIIKKIIKYYEGKIVNLNNKNNIISKKLEDIKCIKEKEINLVIEEKMKKINNKKEINLKKNRQEYLNKMKLLKEKYENEIKQIKRNYEKINNKIINEYKYDKEKINQIYSNKKYLLYKKSKDIIKNSKIKENIENQINLKSSNKLVCDTYIRNKNNFYNAINIHNIIKIYFNGNEFIKKNIIKCLLKSDEQVKIIIRKTEVFKEEKNLSKNEAIISKENKKEKPNPQRRTRFRRYAQKYEEEKDNGEININNNPQPKYIQNYNNNSTYYSVSITNQKKQMQNNKYVYPKQSVFISEKKPKKDVIEEKEVNNDLFLTLFFSEIKNNF